MERVVKVTVDAAGGITPQAPQYAGVQGEHNACRIAFDVTAWEHEPFSYRGEFVGGDGTGGTTAVLSAEEGRVSFLLPAAWTAAGGRAVARLVASVTVDGEETQTVYAVDVPLFFAAKQECTAAAQEEAYTGFTALAEAVQTAVDAVEQKLSDGSLVGPQGPEGKQGVSGVYVGGGEMPDGYNLQIDPDGDASLRLAIGTVETLAAGQPATASITGTADAPLLNLGLPQGAAGSKTAWERIADVSLTKADASYTVVPNGEYTEVFIEGVYTIETEETSAKSINLSLGRTGNAIARNTVSVKKGDTVYHRAWGSITPSRRVVYHTVASTSRFGGNLACNGGDPSALAFDGFDSKNPIVLSLSGGGTHLLGVGSTITIWGR